MKSLVLILTCLALPFGLRADDMGRQILAEINFARTQTKRPLPVTRVLLSGGASRLAGFDR